ncbi:MAG: recombination protein O N-terminal domain-containing protein, partial [Aeriscardovia sp.]|nr:recombination protein O N-terminal domain-containing protein [Aeriscardovia sp.]
MLIEDEGIVLRQWPLGEAGAIFSILTRRHGKARLVSNSIKKNKSMRSSLAPFMRDSFVYWKGKSELSRLSQSSL